MQNPAMRSPVIQSPVMRRGVNASARGGFANRVTINPVVVYYLQVGTAYG